MNLCNNINDERITNFKRKCTDYSDFQIQNEGYIRSSSFVKLKNGDYKRRKKKLSYKDIYLEKKNYIDKIEGRSRSIKNPLSSNNVFNSKSSKNDSENSIEFDNISSIQANEEKKNNNEGTKLNNQNEYCRPPKTERPRMKRNELYNIKTYTTNKENENKNYNAISSTTINDTKPGQQKKNNKKLANSRSTVTLTNSNTIEKKIRTIMIIDKSPLKYKKSPSVTKIKFVNNDDDIQKSENNVTLKSQNVSSKKYPKNMTLTKTTRSINFGKLLKSVQEKNNFNKENIEGNTENVQNRIDKAPIKNDNLPNKWKKGNEKLLEIKGDFGNFIYNNEDPEKKNEKILSKTLCTKNDDSMTSSFISTNTKRNRALTTMNNTEMRNVKFKKNKSVFNYKVTLAKEKNAFFIEDEDDKEPNTENRSKSETKLKGVLKNKNKIKKRVRRIVNSNGEIEEISEYSSDSDSFSKDKKNKNGISNSNFECDNDKYIKENNKLPDMLKKKLNILNNNNLENQINFDEFNKLNNEEKEKYLDNILKMNNLDYLFDPSNENLLEKIASENVNINLCPKNSNKLKTKGTFLVNESSNGDEDNEDENQLTFKSKRKLNKEQLIEEALKKGTLSSLQKIINSKKEIKNNVNTKEIFSPISNSNNRLNSNTDLLFSSNKRDLYSYFGIERNENPPDKCQSSYRSKNNMDFMNAFNGEGFKYNRYNSSNLNNLNNFNNFNNFNSNNSNNLYGGNLNMNLGGGYQKMKSTDFKSNIETYKANYEQPFNGKITDLYIEKMKKAGTYTEKNKDRNNNLYKEDSFYKTPKKNKKMSANDYRYEQIKKEYLRK